MSYRVWEKTIDAKGIVCDGCGLRVEIDSYCLDEKRGRVLAGWHIGSTYDSTRPHSVDSSTDICPKCFKALIASVQPVTANPEDLR